MAMVSSSKHLRFQTRNSMGTMARTASAAPAPTHGTPKGEHLAMRHPAKQPNRTEAIIDLLAATISARKEAASARQEAGQAESRMQAQQKRQDALTKAADAFNGTVRSVRSQLTQAESDSCSLADREKVAGSIDKELATASTELNSLDPAAQMPAQSVIDGLSSRAQAVQARAKSEQAQVDAVTKGLTEDTSKLKAAMDGGDTDKIANELKSLYQKYQNPAALVKGLPADAQKSLTSKIQAAQKPLDWYIVQYSNHYEVDHADNSYMFGRPGPKMKKAATTVGAFVSAPKGSVTEDQRAKVISALDQMHQALGDFQDPMTKDAAQHVYNDLSARALGRLANS